MFTKSRSDLAYLTRQLYALRLDQLCRLVRWLGPRGLPNFTGSGHSKASSTNQSFGSSSPARPGSPGNQCGHSSPGRPVPCQRSSGSPVPRSGRLWRTHLAGLHRIYKRVSEVADRFSNEYPTELRFILQSCVEMHDTSREVAAIAQMEGRDLDEQDGATDSGESSEVALEGEVHLGEHVFADASKSYSALAQLLDWSGVVSCRKIKQSLSDVLKTSCSHFERTKPGTPELSPGSPTKHAVDEASECDQQNESLSLELGLDVAAWLEDDRQRDNRSSRHETQASCFPRCSTELNRNDGTATGEPSTFSQKMSKLNLGTAVEGKRTSDDRLFHYLPPWQPDRLGDLSPSHTEATDSDEASESDQYSESDQSPVLVIGRRCASCLQSFTIFRRRHHCRRCGHIFCGSCCNKWQTVEGLATTKAVRICSECHEFLNTSV
ncbi:FYVE zinc finger, partial [Opisthorchis viverrini]